MRKNRPQLRCLPTLKRLYSDPSIIVFLYYMWIRSSPARTESRVIFLEMGKYWLKGRDRVLILSLAVLAGF